MAALISENFKFLSLFFKSKDVVIFNGLIALGTVASQTAYNIFAFSCPCSPERNYLYGLAAIGVPALALFLIGVMLNRNTWSLVSECRIRFCRRLTCPAGFALLGSILGRAAVAPVTWTVLSLLRGEAYVCARSEFVDPASLVDFPEGYGPQIMARFPCRDVPAVVLPFWPAIERQLKYESQLLGWLLTGLIAVSLFLLLCLKRCCSPLGAEQEAYWKNFRYSEDQIFERTAGIHAKLLATESVKQFFGFVALEQEDKQQLEQYQAQNNIPRSQWNNITGVYLYKEKSGVPLYSQLNKWATATPDNNVEVTEMNALC
ncbi:calcium homeostasis modulator protein 2.1 [Paramormyrops kingsleyae]|uniref:Calcium homeostasis modulator family member 2, tandem duplicate 2 n=1 Tax=Paramormyrops kingsleyae TaxID=1676925 RepID=A0A3B3RBE3_9TELE|nr:calcium homeostasis modulator protein 2 [Paramormyrops kingsleyae]